MRKRGRILGLIVIAWAVLLRPAKSGEPPLEKIDQLLYKAASEYIEEKWGAAFQDFQTVLDTANRFGYGRSATLYIFRIWKKGSETSGTSVTPIVSDATLERSINSLRRFDESADPFGATGYTEGEESRLWRAYLLAQYYEVRGMPGRVVDQKREAKLVHQRLLATKERQTERKARLEIYLEYVNSSLELAEAYFANSDRDKCKAELASLARFYQETFGKDVKMTEYQIIPEQGLYLAAEMPMRLSRCYRRLGMANEAKVYAGVAEKGVKEFREKLGATAEKYETRIKEIEKGLKE